MLIRLLQRIEDGILVGLMLTMIGMAVVQIGMRNLFDAGIIWGDSLVRVLVLWIGLMGAMVASRTDNHIRIDVISRYLPGPAKRFTAFITHLFTTMVCGTMTWYSVSFVRMEMADNLTAFSNVPAWVCELIIPVAFFVMALRYLIFTLQGLVEAIVSDPS